MIDVCENPNKVCRACRSEAVEEKYNMLQSSTLYELYARLSATQIDANDMLSKTLCTKCHDSLQEFDVFQNMCINSYKILLQKYTENALKCEETVINIVKNEFEYSNDLLETTKNKVELDSDKDDVNCSTNGIEYDPFTVETELGSHKSGNDLNENITKSNEDDSDDETLIAIVEKLKQAKKILMKGEDYARNDIQNEKQNTMIETTIKGSNENLSTTSSHSQQIVSKSRRVNKSKKANPLDDALAIENHEKKETEEHIDEATRICKDEDKPRTDPYVCQKCSKNFYSKLHYEGHLRIHQGKKPYACQNCPREYSRLSRLKDHILHDHSGERVRLHCTVKGCERKYKNRQSLDNHLISHFNPQAMKRPEKITVVCEFCGKSLSKGVMREHEMMHKGIFPHVCDQCPKKFRFRNKLEEHKLVHLGVKKYSCPVCGMKKTTKKEVKAHMNVHTREKEYPCQFCKSCFLTNANLVRHIRVVHDGIKTFHCTFCDQSFGKSETLKHHMMRHTGERPHKCPHCERRFIQKAAMKMHAKRHEKKGEQIEMVTNECT